MRVIFNEELKAVADDLDRMVQDVRKAINGAGDALINQNLEAAQAVIDGDIEIDALESSVIDQCVKLLAKQSPVATDLRVVVSTLRLAATFERMGDLARHIAEAARRTYPASPLPAEAQPLFAEMQAFLDNVADQMTSMLSDRDTKTAEEIILNDADHDRLGTKVTAAANALAVKRGLPGELKLAETTRPITGGVVLRQGDIEVNCTLDSLLELSRGSLDAEVARILFQ